MKLEMLLLKTLFAAVMGLTVLLFTSMLTLQVEPVRLAHAAGPAAASSVSRESRAATTLPTCPLPPDQVTCFRAG